MRIVVTGAAGYVGSALMEALPGAERVDWAPFGNWVTDYKVVLAAHFAPRYDVIIHLAAHSSVKACQANPEGAWSNNVTSFEGLLRNMRRDAILIYASSASVYNGLAGQASEDAALLPPVALYDATKRTMDDLARLSGLRAYGLRFGTVCGPSPNMRPELLLNAMTRSAIEQGFVKVQNPQARRSVLGISDAVGAILHLIDGKAEPGIYNVASVHGTMETIGREVAYHCGVPCVVDTQPLPHYDFLMDTTKLQRIYTPRATVASIVSDLKEVYSAELQRVR